MTYVSGFNLMFPIGFCQGNYGVSAFDWFSKEGVLVLCHQREEFPLGIFHGRIRLVAIVVVVVSEWRLLRFEKKVIGDELQDDL